MARWASFAAAGFVLIAGCAGSSSETPWPLAPNQEELTASERRMTASAAASAPRSRHLGEVDADDDERRAPSTWGDGRRRPAPRSAPSADPADVPDVDDE